MNHKLAPESSFLHAFWLVQETPSLHTLHKQGPMVEYVVTVRKNLQASLVCSDNTVDTALNMQICQLYIVDILANSSFNNAVSTCDIY
jgi:hypothetical protein